MVWTPGQSVSFVVGSRFMDDGELVAAEFEGPAGLVAGEFLFCCEVYKVTVICPDFEWVKGTF